MSCLISQLRKFQNRILYIRNKHSLQLQNISLINIPKIYMYLFMKTKQKNRSSLAAILDAILYQGSLITCSQMSRSYFEPFFAWNNLNLMQ